MKNKKLIFIIFVIIIFGAINVCLVFFNPFQEVIADHLNLDEQEATIRAIQKVSPSVVSIKVIAEENIGSVLINNEEKQDITGKVERNGTGFLVSANGLILTNKHVVDVGDVDNVFYQVIFSNQKAYEAKLIDEDPVSDLAFLKIEGNNFPYVKLGDSDDLQVGTTVIAIGNSLGEYQNSATKGIISGLKRSILTIDNNGNTEAFSNILQTDAEINHGNSGGPLLNLYGEVIGINVAKSDASDSIGFAIPINDAKKAIQTVEKYGRIIRPKLGVRYVMLDSDIAKILDAPRDTGAIIIRDEEGHSAISRGSAAEKAGLQVGDVIFEINAIKLNKDNNLLSVIQMYKPGDRIGIKVQRGDKIFIKELTLGEF